MDGLEFSKLKESGSKNESKLKGIVSKSPVKRLIINTYCYLVNKVTMLHNTNSVLNFKSGTIQRRVWLKIYETSLPDEWHRRGDQFPTINDFVCE